MALRGCSIYSDPQDRKPEIINSEDSIESSLSCERVSYKDFEIPAKNAQTESSTELDSVALRTNSIYSDPQVPPTMKSEIRSQKSELSHSETIGNINIDRINSNISLPDRVEEIIDNSKTSDFRLQTSNFERSDCVPPTQNINSEDLVASLLNRSEQLISLEIPTDEEPQPGDRVYSPITEQKGILQSFGDIYSSVLWDGTTTTRSIYSHVIQKLEEVEVDRLKLVDAISSLRNVINNSNVIKSIKQLPKSVVRSAIYWLRVQRKEIITVIQQIIKQIDYEFYIELSS
ncbi:MAG: hypothetical protein ACFBSE_13870 [Prochloraceae cyanobacterium]